MPVNKDARLRHKIINDCLRNTMRKWTKKELIDTLNEKLAEHYSFESNRRRIDIKERQFNYDINDMRTIYGAPIEQGRDGKSYYYFYEDPEFSVEQQQLKDDDLQLLREAVNLLTQIKGFSISQDIDTVVSRLESRIMGGTPGAAQVIAFENPPEMMGIENLGDLYQAIMNKVVLRITYKPYKAPEAQDHIIHPYFLKEYNNRWFLFGWNADKKRVDNMALDRIQGIRVVHQSYIPNTVFQPDSFFSDMIGVTRMTNAPETVTIKVGADRAPYMESKPLHHSQTILKRYKDGSMSFRYQLIINRELVSALLGFGGLVEVKEPAALREMIAEQLALALASYS